MTFICSLAEIPENRAKGLVVNERALLVIKKDGVVRVYLNHCPHHGTPLDWMPDQFMDHQGKHLQCSTHGALFRVDDGECIAGPCQGESLEALAFELRDDCLYLANC